jgi:Tol biopolymer transport system component
VTLASNAAGSPVTAGNNRSYGVRLSGDGQWLAFTTDATNLGANDTTSYKDVFLVEVATGAKTLVSHSHLSATQPGAYGHSFFPSLSTDGRFVAFESQAVDLVAGQVDGNNGSDIFLFDRTTGTNILLSHTPAGSVYAGDHGAEDPQVSADGNWVVFVSRATNLFSTPDANGSLSDIVLYERATGAITLVSHAASSLTTTPDNSSTLPAVSADGSAVVFLSTATDLISGQIDLGTNSDVFHYDRSTGTVSLASRDVASPTTGGNGTSPTFPPRPSISASGSVLIFASDASNLVSADGNGSWDAFLFQP